MSDTKSLIPRISIIIPAYNTATFLDRAIRNIAEEQFSDCDSSFWELIIVNDGSTDTTADIAGQWQKRYPRNIHILNQSNQGVSAARNAGIEMAQGEYIYFMDSDDLLRQNTLPDLVDKAKRHGLEMLAFNFRIITPGEYDSMHTKAPEPIQSPEPTTMSAYDYLWITKYLAPPFGLWEVWRAIYNRTFINRHNIRFSPDLMCGEDSIFILGLIFANPSFALLPTIYYFYNNLRISNASTDVNPEHLNKFATNRALYICHLQKFKSIIYENSQIPYGCIDTIDASAKYYYKKMCIDAIMLNASFKDILKMRRWFRHKGGKIKPGGPSFSNKSLKYTAKQKIKRWIIAYPLAILMGIYDGLSGHGMWIDKKILKQKIELRLKRNENPKQRKSAILANIPSPAVRRIAIIIDQFDPNENSTTELNKIVRELTSTHSAEILLFVPEIEPEHIPVLKHIGYFPLTFQKLNDTINPNMHQAAWTLATMSDLQGVDTILLKAKRNIAPEAITPTLAKVINLDSDQLSWKQAFEVAGL